MAISFPAALQVLGQRVAAFLLPAAEPAPDYPFTASELAQLLRHTSAATAPAIDKQTWNDLLLDQYGATLGKDSSLFGRQVLHQRLAAGSSATERAALGQRLRALIDDPARMARLQGQCAPMRHATDDVAAFMFGPHQRTAMPGWLPFAGLVGPLLLLGLGATFVWAWAWAVVGLALALLLAAQVRYHGRIERWKRTLHSLQMLLSACSQLGQHDGPLADLASRADQTRRAISRLRLNAFMPGMDDYSDWVMMGNVRHYYRSVRRVDDALDLLRHCYQRCAGLEADLALARHLCSTPTYCWAGHMVTPGFTLEQAVHPLLERAQPLSLSLHQKGAFLSGQNGIGKSTLLRTIGLNLVAARAFGFCYASAAATDGCLVFASMANEDSLATGESLYQSELRRAHELLASARTASGGIYLIDEIFRGTNHHESVAAAAAVLDALACHGVVVVSSHNLVLAPLLAHCLSPWCVDVDAAGVLQLRPGVLAHTNGITLLTARGFAPGIAANAGKVYDWLSAFLSHPSDGHLVLGAEWEQRSARDRTELHDRSAHALMDAAPAGADIADDSTPTKEPS